jgi:hypothetical protein
MRLFLLKEKKATHLLLKVRTILAPLGRKQSSQKPLVEEKMDQLVAAVIL